MQKKNNCYPERSIKQQSPKLTLVIALFLLAFFHLCPGMALAEPYDYSESLKIEPIFLMNEPWTTKNFSEQFSKMTCMKTCEEADAIGLGKQYADSCEYGRKQSITNPQTQKAEMKWKINGDFVKNFQNKSECIKTEDLEIVQGKTVKNKAGKAYFVTAAKKYKDDGYAILGYRDMRECEGECDEAYDVQFYLMYTNEEYNTFLKQWGSVYRSSTHHEIVDIYRHESEAVTFVEFDFIFTGERNCGHPEEDNPQKCKAKQYESRVVRKVIMINSMMDLALDIQSFPRGAILSVATIGNAVGVSSSLEGSIKAARKKIKGVKDLKSIAFTNPAGGEDLNCTMIKDKKTKEYRFTCPRF